MMSFGDRSQAGSALANPRVPSAMGSIGGTYSHSGTLGLTSNSYNSASQGSQAALGGYSSLQHSHTSTYPINPDVRLKKLPFYDILGELLKPSTLGEFFL